MSEDVIKETHLFAVDEKVSHDGAEQINNSSKYSSERSLNRVLNFSQFILSQLCCAETPKRSPQRFVGQQAHVVPLFSFSSHSFLCGYHPLISSPSSTVTL
jgi:VanZ family protein